MAYSANGYLYSTKRLSRVKYNMTKDGNNGTLPKAPQMIKVEINTTAADIFFDSSNDYEPNTVDMTTIDQIYSNQIFTDIVNQKNMVWIDEAVTGDCLTTMQNYINYGD